MDLSSFGIVDDEKHNKTPTANILNYLELSLKNDKKIKRTISRSIVNMRAIATCSYSQQ